MHKYDYLGLPVMMLVPHHLVLVCTAQISADH